MSVGEHRQGDVAVAALERAHLVLVETDLTLGLLEAALDGRARASDPHEIAQRRAVRSLGEIEGPLTRIGQRAAHQKRALEAGRGSGVGYWSRNHLFGEPLRW